MAKSQSIELSVGDHLHVETPLGVINIRCGLTDMRGRAIDSVVLTPDAYPDENRVVVRGMVNTRFVRLKTKQNHFRGQIGQ